MKKTLILFIAIFSFVSCDKKIELNTVIVKNKYSITLPYFLSETKDLNNEASLQYQNIYKEFYVIVMDEPKEEFNKTIDDNNLEEVYSKDLNGFLDIIIAETDSNISKFNKDDVIDTTINNLPAKLVSFTRKTEMVDKPEGIDIFYSIALIEGKKNYYQLVSWTYAKKEEQYSGKMEDMFRSFEEL